MSTLKKQFTTIFEEFNEEDSHFHSLYFFIGGSDLIYANKGQSREDIIINQQKMQVIKRKHSHLASLPLIEQKFCLFVGLDCFKMVTSHSCQNIPNESIIPTRVAEDFILNNNCCIFWNLNTIQTVQLKRDFELKLIDFSIHPSETATKYIKDIRTGSKDYFAIIINQNQTNDAILIWDMKNNIEN